MVHVIGEPTGHLVTIIVQCVRSSHRADDNFSHINSLFCETTYFPHYTLFVKNSDAVTISRDYAIIVGRGLVRST
jgi:hypothetical protein